MRKKFLVKPGLQLKHLFWTLLIVLVCVGAGYSLFETRLTALLGNGSIDMARWLELRTTLRWGFAILLLILLVAIGIENYFYFHKVVGPIYALEKGLRRLAQGDFRDVTRIRETDEFGELIAAFEQTKKLLQVRLESEEKTAQLLANELDRLLNDPSLAHIEALRKKLRALRDQVEKKAA